MRNDSGRLALGIVVVRLRLIQLFQCRLQGIRHPTLDCPHSLLGEDNGHHLRLCYVLVQLAGTVEIALGNTVSLLAPLLERTPASQEGQGRSLAVWQVASEEALDDTESLSKAPLAFQGHDGI